MNQINILTKGLSSTCQSMIRVFFFYVFLTMHLSIILVINQLNAQILVS